MKYIEDPSNLSPELDWMLLSTQASDGMVREAIAREFGAQIYLLALSYLNDQKEAEQATLETLIAVTANRHKYSGNSGVRSWLVALTLQSCRERRRRRWLRQASRAARRLIDRAGRDRGTVGAARRETEVDRHLWYSVDRLPDPLRVPLLLSLVHGLQPLEIAQVTGRSEELARHRLQQARQVLHKSLRRRLCQLRVGERRRIGLPGLEHLRARDLSVSRLAGENLQHEELSFLNEHLRSCSACHATAIEFAELENLLQHSLRGRWPLAAAAAPQPEILLNRVEARLSARRKQGRVLAPANQLAWGAAMLALALVVGWASNLLFPRSATPSIYQVTPQSTQIMQVPVQVTRYITPTPEPTLAPLSEASTPQEIVRRMTDSNQSWQSLWADALIFRYGPAGYKGPSQVYRNQIWVQQPEQFMVLSGPTYAEPDFITFSLYGSIYEMDIKAGLTYYYRTDEQFGIGLSGPPSAFQEAGGDPRRALIEGDYVKPLLFPAQIAQHAKDLQVIESESVPGGKALVVEANIDELAPNLLGAGDWAIHPATTTRYRLWLDSQTGVILCWQRFDPSDLNTVTEEVILSRLVFNTAFPEKSYSSYFFSPGRFVWENEWRPDKTAGGISGFFQVPAGGRLASETPQPAPKAPPAGAQDAIDLARVRLTFVWSYHSDHKQAQSGIASIIPDRTADIYAGSTYLGSAELGNPWYLSCRRSPDGKLIAYTEEVGQPFDPVANLGWLALGASPTAVHSLLTPGGVAGSGLAFSPDSRSLAFWSCVGGENNCSVRIYDFETQKVRKLLSSRNAAFFTWSPDGKFLAMIRQSSSPDGQAAPEVTVVDAVTGALAYQGEVDLATGKIPDDSPTHAWGVPFPPPRTGLEGCIAPPAPPLSGLTIPGLFPGLSR